MPFHYIYVLVYSIVMGVIPYTINNFNLETHITDKYTSKVPWAVYDAHDMWLQLMPSYEFRRELEWRVKSNIHVNTLYTVYSCEQHITNYYILGGRNCTIITSRWPLHQLHLYFNHYYNCVKALQQKSITTLSFFITTTGWYI